MPDNLIELSDESFDDYPAVDLVQGNSAPSGASGTESRVATSKPTAHTQDQDDDILQSKQSSVPYGVDNTASTKNNARKKSKLPSASQAKKQKVAEERAAKKHAEEMNKVYKPGECMKYMTVEAHPSLLAEWWFSDVSRELAAAGARLRPAAALVHPALVVWGRALPRGLHQGSGQLQLSPASERCTHALYVTTAEDVAVHVCEHTLASQLAEMRALVDCSLTLVVFGVKDYLKSTRRKTSNSSLTTMSEIDLELALTDVLVSSECDTAIVNTPNELALLIVQLTKAIAEAPYKLRQREAEAQAQYYMRADSKKCVALDKDGIAVGKVWQQMIAVLPHSSLEMSRALVAQYPTPVELFDAIQSPDCVQELADIGVSRANVPGARARRVGPEFAKKLRILFTAEDGNTIVD